jgi:cysteine synthase A
LKKQDPNIKIYAVEPTECPVPSKQRWGTHQIEGVGGGFIPSIFDISLLDGVVLVSSERAIWMTKRIPHDEGLSPGISSGANMKVCIRPHKRHPELKRVAMMLSDHGFRYSFTLFFGEVKAVSSPEHQHSTELTPQQREWLSKLEVIG